MQKEEEKTGYFVSVALYLLQTLTHFGFHMCCLCLN